MHTRGFRWGLVTLSLLAIVGPAGAKQGTRASFRAVDRVMRQGVKDRTFQSAVLLVSQRGRPLFHRSYGSASLDSVFDLASLTKPLAASTTMMRLMESGRLAPETRLKQVIPSLSRRSVGSVTLGQLLSHSSGLPARNSLAAKAQGLSPRLARAKVKRLAARHPRTYRPGSRTLYSDLNFILLGWALERAGGASLDRLAQRLVFKPLGLGHTGFIPLDRHGPKQNNRTWRVVPTERVPGQGHLRGQVHDEKARAMGGVAGHAGLFGSAADVQRVLESLASAYNGRPSIFSSKVVRQFFDARPVAGSTRALGWDRPSAHNSSTGSLFKGGHTVGHLGFTGTSVWLDLKQDLSVVLLTNRVYHGRDPAAIRSFRPQLHDAVAGALRKR